MKWLKWAMETRIMEIPILGVIMMLGLLGFLLVVAFWVGRANRSSSSPPSPTVGDGGLGDARRRHQYRMRYHDTNNC